MKGNYLNLNLQIEELISKNSTDFEVSQTIKDEIKTYISSLDTIFEKDQGKSFLVKHTKSIDIYIKTIFKYSLRKHFGEYLPLVNTLPITVVALGSYAREQLCVYSDIDLMLVYKEVDGYNLKPIIETILQIAWDSGLKLGHRVHKIDELLEVSRSDQTIKTALIESRYLCGSKYLWTQTERELSTIRKDMQKEFILSKIKEREQRLKKYPFNMQPNIKSSAGGLRDVNTLFWIANTLFGVTKIKHLIPNTISDLEYSSMMHSIEFLYRVRAALHISADKKQDKLLLHYIPDIAKKLGLSQRRLVEKTFESMLKIETVCEYLIHKITDRLFSKNLPFKEIKSYRFSKNIYIIEDRIYSPLHAKIDNLEQFIDLFLVLDDKSYYYETTYIHILQNVKNNRVEFKKIKKLFYKKHLYSFFIALYKAKKLGIVFPPMSKVSHLPQFDGYHKYPVDIHSIRTLLALENIEDKNVKKVFDSFNKEEKALLRVTAFLHDCGKGRKKDHSHLGAVIVKNYLQLLGYESKYINYAYKLVYYHTLMSNISSREDVYSEKVIFSFISKLGDIKVLQLLYVLTYADIESVGKGRYSNFNSKLLNELFLIASEAFKNQNMITEAQKRAKKEKLLKSDDRFKRLSSVLKKKILSIESNLLFFKYKPEEITKISSWVFNLKKDYDYTITNDKNVVIEIIRQKDLNLGYLLGKLPNLSVASMDIFKIFNNIKYFRVEFFESADESELFFIDEIISNSFDMKKKIKLNKPNMKEDEIKINCNHSKSYASMSVDTKDIPQLLANIMSTFDDIGIDIASAKIQTIKKRARNLFLIEKNGNFCKNQEEVVKRLTTNIDKEI
jgi:[protein-PII] uridylyltransferase